MTKKELELENKYLKEKVKRLEAEKELDKSRTNPPVTTPYPQPYTPYWSPPVYGPGPEIPFNTFPVYCETNDRGDIETSATVKLSGDSKSLICSAEGTTNDPPIITFGFTKQ